ncbi:MAG: DUF5106 domain-containing protein [Bacteroidales bacterium]|nr:DUF5106 domain-containing protein [Bacteroidales bacterium]
MKKLVFSTRILLLATLICLPNFALSKEKKDKKDGKASYRISLHVDGASDDTVYMGNYYAKGTYAIDTALNDGKGNYVFSRDRELFPGLYFFTNQKGKFFEFVVYHEKPEFSFNTKDDDWKKHVKVKGSKENEIFYAFHNERRSMTDELEAASKRMSEEEFKEFRNGMLRKNDSLMLKYISMYPDCMFTKMMEATKPIEVPLVNDKGDSLTATERWEYYAAHYFDNMPLGDDFIVRTPENVFYKKIEDYFNVTLKNTMPDFIISHIDAMVDKSRTAPEVFKYLVHTTSERFLQSNVMVYDEVYVHMIHRYYATGEAVWASPSSIDENVKRADTWEKILVGKQAPELILYDTLHHPHALSMECKRHQYTLLMFWSPTCGHCKVTIPEMHEIYEKYSKDYDIAAFAILSEPDDHTRPLWKKFIHQHNLDWLNLDGGECNVDWKEVYDVTTTPKIFLLDRDRKIIAKKFSPETFEGIIKNQLEKVK